MNSFLKDELHRRLATKMLVAGVPNPEIAVNVAIGVFEETIKAAGQAILLTQEQVDDRLKLMRRGYRRSTVLSPEDKEKHIAVETARIVGVKYGGTIEPREKIRG